MRVVLAEWRRFFRRIIYPTGFLAAAGVVASFYGSLSTEYVSISYFYIIIASIAVIALLLELFSRLNGGSTQTYKDQAQGLHALGSLSDQIRNARTVHLLGTTFKSFTDNDSNLRAVQLAIASGADVRLLMMNPIGEEINRMLIARQDRNRSYTETMLRNEIMSSVARISNVLGNENCDRSVRFYRSSRSVSIYRFDNTFLVTCYTHGRGGSSPILLHRSRDVSKDEFAISLIRGIDELWAASSTLRFSQAVKMDDIN